MCILSVKRQSNRVIATFNREEKKNTYFETVGYHWSQAPEIQGYLDKNSNGTWLAWNRYMIGFLLNKEDKFNETYRTSRGDIIIDILSSCQSINEAVRFCSKYHFEKYAPFNLVLIDTSFRIYYISNRNSNNQKAIERFGVQNDFFMLNRSCINDFSQSRIRCNYQEMSYLLDSYTMGSTMLSSFLLRASYCEKQADEKNMFLCADEWCTCSSTIILIQNGTITVKSIYENQS